MKKKLSTDKAPNPAGPYSQGLKVGNRVYVAGQGPMDVNTGKLAGASVGEQTRQVLENIKAILDVGGTSMNDVVKTTVHLSNLADFEEFNEVYGQFFAEPYPVRTTVQSVLNGILVEIDVVAELD